MNIRDTLDSFEERLDDIDRRFLSSEPPQDHWEEILSLLRAIKDEVKRVEDRQTDDGDDDQNPLTPIVDEIKRGIRDRIINWFIDYLNDKFGRNLTPEERDILRRFEDGDRRVDPLPGAPTHTPLPDYQPDYIPQSRPYTSPGTAIPAPSYVPMLQSYIQDEFDRDQRLTQSQLSTIICEAMTHCSSSLRQMLDTVDARTCAMQSSMHESSQSIQAALAASTSAKLQGCDYSQIRNEIRRFS